jgi:hypothetical protein
MRAASAALALLLVAAAPAPALPKVPLHSAYVVAVNAHGQVTHVLSGALSKNRAFDLQTFGNAEQAFIRTTDGRSISGRYRLSYDYDPKTARVRRTVALIAAGGVDPNAEGAALRMLDDLKKHAAKK